MDNSPASPIKNAHSRGTVQGTQVVARACLVLRLVSEYSPGGASTATIAVRSRLTRPTVHRLLSSLAAEGFLDHDSRGGHWHPGPELFVLGMVAAQRYDISDLARETVRQLAAQTGESAFLSARRGNETVCLLREDGSFPVRSFVLYEGVRFPLGVASAGLAILSHLPDDEVEAYLTGTAADSRFGDQHWGVALRDRIRLTREMGYAVNPGLIVEGSWGMAAAVFDQTGLPGWALSITGIESRFRPDRQPELGSLLLRAAHDVTRALGSLGRAQGPVA
ncbi:IclR family transcriptional regulator [Cryobacterium adonitolivorans]|uniref:IclR family transcriptional regulator n=1 Tax=Cryobacterium adonitolivorans TaxID=1259189 RepID=UPI001F53FD63|nr:IclR family transcriptional regulator [Cryobacterium adonitolivorans]